jgi:hypothetical protein
MIVRRLAARGIVRRGSTDEEPRRKRASRYLLIIFSAGALAGLASLLGVWPFGDVRAEINRLLYRVPPAIAASTIFPAVQPVHQVVDVYDPPPASRRTQPQPTSPATSPPHASPTGRPHASPTPATSPRPDD